MEGRDTMDRFRLLAEIITSRRSIRKFNGEPVDQALLKRILRLATHAPSNNNRQGWRFYLVCNREVIATMYRQVEKALQDAEKGAGLIQEVLASYRTNFLHFKAAPVVMACCFVKPSRFPGKVFQTTDENRHLTGELLSLAMCIQNLLLLVETAGLGAVVMTAPLIAAQALKDTLDIPAKYSIGALVSMGHFDVKPPAPPHKPLQDVLRIIA